MPTAPSRTADPAGPAYSRRELSARVLWTLAMPLFRFSPRPAFGWRRALLRAFGARVGRGVRVYGSTLIYLPWRLRIDDDAALGEYAFIYNLGIVHIGARALIAPRAHLCAGTHDHRDPAMPLLRPPITIGADAWVCAEAFIGPGVTVGAGTVVGARAVVMRDLPSWVVAVGHPARVVGPRRWRGADP